MPDKARSFFAIAVAASLGLGAAASAATGSEDSAGEYGPAPRIEAPAKSLIPTVNIAKAVGWKNGMSPRTAAGSAIAAFATGLMHPRWLYVLPNGDVLVAESDAPSKPDDGKGIAGEVHKWVMKRAGSGAEPSANRITLLRDAGGNGTATERHIFLQGLNSPIGMALIGDSLYVADTDAVLRFPYVKGETEIHATPVMVTALPAGTINHHWTKSLIASPYSYYGQHVDDRVKPQNPDLVAKAIAPDYALGAHTASLGLCWSTGSNLPGLQHGMFVGQHGSWNRKTSSGYKVVFVPFAQGKPAGEPVEVLGGFLDAHHHALGRPVDVAMDKSGALLVADDVGNVVWRVSPAAHPATASNHAAPTDEDSGGP